jgi:hypothetical protein
MRNPLELAEVETDRKLGGATKQYRLHELAEELDTSPENVEHWLSEDGIGSVSADKPDHYAEEALERLRARVQGKSSDEG